MEESKGVSVAPDYVCICFQWVPESLIEEPEVCEFCQNWRDGFCVREDTERR